MKTTVDAEIMRAIVQMSTAIQYLGEVIADDAYSAVCAMFLTMRMIGTGVEMRIDTIVEARFSVALGESFEEVLVRSSGEILETRPGIVAAQCWQP